MQKENILDFESISPVHVLTVGRSDGYNYLEIGITELTVDDEGVPRDSFPPCGYLPLFHSLLLLRGVSKPRSFSLAWCPRIRSKGSS